MKYTFTLFLIFLFENFFPQENKDSTITIFTNNKGLCCCVSSTLVILDSSKFLDFYSYDFKIFDSIQIKNEKITKKELSQDTLRIEFFVNTTLNKKFEPVAYCSKGDWINIDVKNYFVQDSNLHYIKENINIKWPFKNVPNKVLYKVREIK